VIGDRAVHVAQPSPDRAAAGVGGSRLRRAANRLVERRQGGGVLTTLRESDALLQGRGPRGAGRRRHDQGKNPLLHGRVHTPPRSRSSAAWVACHLTAAGSPAKWKRRVSASSLTTRPT